MVGEGEKEYGKGQEMSKITEGLKHLINHGKDFGFYTE